MQRLIDADKLLLDNSWAFYDENGNRNDACIAVENAPTVDAVEVIRCKDCKFYWKNDRDGGGVVCLATPKDDAFCSEGERRKDDYEEPEINPCRGCEDYDGKGGCLSHGGCGERREDAETN